MKFKSKIDWWLHLIFLLVSFTPVWLFALYIRDKISSILIICVIFLLVDVLLVLPIYLFTFYTLEDTALHIRCGLFTSQIEYKDINGIYETRNPMSSLGLSLDRILINYSKGEVLISPKNKQEFIRLLKQRTL